MIEDQYHTDRYWTAGGPPAGPEAGRRNARETARLNPGSRQEQTAGAAGLRSGVGSGAGVGRLSWGGGVTTGCAPQIPGVWRMGGQLGPSSRRRGWAVCAGGAPWCPRTGACTLGLSHGTAARPPHLPGHRTGFGISQRTLA